MRPLLDLVLPAPKAPNDKIERERHRRYRQARMISCLTAERVVVEAEGCEHRQGGNDVGDGACITTAKDGAQAPA